MRGRIKGDRLAGRLKREADVAMVILLHHGKHRAVAGLDAISRMAAVKGTSKTVLSIDADKCPTLWTVVQWALQRPG